MVPPRVTALGELTLTKFYDRLVEEHVTKGFLVYENGAFHLFPEEREVMKDLMNFLQRSGDFDRHEAVFFQRHDEPQTTFFAFIHDTRRGLAHGGCRISEEKTIGDLLTDGLRLSKGMTQKNALAGLAWGGGKGIIAVPKGYSTPTDFRKHGQHVRRPVFEGYGRFVASLRGAYYTAEDMHTNTPDMDILLSENRFTTCVAERRGGSGNPSPVTARGVFNAIKAAYKKPLDGARVSVEGAGNVGTPLIKLLLEAGARIALVETDEDRRKAAAQMAADVKRCTPEEFDSTYQSARMQIIDTNHSADDTGGHPVTKCTADIFVPCAGGKVLNSVTIPLLGKNGVKLVCGPANNQLDTPDDANLLVNEGITYVTDFLCNRMGIVNCADEWLGHLVQDVEVIAERLGDETDQIVKFADRLGLHENEFHEAVVRLADRAACEPHPLFGHRGRRLIDRAVRAWRGQEDLSREVQGNDAKFVPYERPLLTAAKQAASGDSSLVMAAPISAASHAHIGSFLSVLLADVEARQRGVRAVLVGSDSGGLALRAIVDGAQPSPGTDDDAIARRRFEYEKRFHANVASTREQLVDAGIAFDASRWIEPFGSEVRAMLEAMRRLLHDKFVDSDEAKWPWCPRCETVIDPFDVAPAEGKRGERCRFCGAVLVGKRRAVTLPLAAAASAESPLTWFETGEVTISPGLWKDKAIDELRRFVELRISQTSPWAVPMNVSDFHSDSFTVAAWAFCMAGWTLGGSSADFRQIEIVFADSEQLRDYILPTLWLSSMLFGRPLFKAIHVHGMAYVEEFEPPTKIAKRVDIENGNVSEPRTYVSRFGADAFRLWLLLCVERDCDKVILTDANLRRAIKAIGDLNDALSLLWENRSESADPEDQRILEACNKAATEIEERNYGAAAAKLIEVSDAMSAPGFRTEATKLMNHLQRLAPLCPFILAHYENKFAGAVK